MSLNPRQMQQMALKMQQKMEKIQEELGESMVEGTAGGGAVTVKMTGHREVRSVTISPEIVDPNEVEMLQELIMIAFNDASKKAQELAQERMGTIIGGMQIPGLF